MARSEKSSGPSFVRRVPEGDLLPRRVCESCGFVDYENPKIVVGSVCYWHDKLLLCRRAIDPRKGYWTLPAGYLELNESADAGARREAWEEARAEIEIEQLLGVYSIARISQVQLIYRARLLSPDVAPGPETRELELFSWDSIPWKEVAFPSVLWALEHYRRSREQSVFAPFANPESATGELPPAGSL
ncbi:MAG: NUDIX hydrolase [Kiloniellales bacterium]|jgi:ADP-ribose pyrophosphatase YjhB (NUDIX family)|nr:NUDIX hydrolase [Kiloniellales bacterium]